jgi:subtilisin
MSSALKRPLGPEEVAAPIVPTGNFLVRFDRALSTKEQVGLLHKGNGRVVTASDFQCSEINMDKLVQYSEAVLLDHLGIAVLRGNDDGEHRQLTLLAKKHGVVQIIPEFYLFAYDDEVSGGGSEDDHSGTHEDSLSCTWGLEAVGACSCQYTGKGIKLGILDSGFDRWHPDYAGRHIRYWSAFGCDARDVCGHGTHCAGIAAGPRAVANRMRYGVAPDADLHIYKVLNDSGTGTDGQVLAGINQAMVDGCDVMSLSLGRQAGRATTSNIMFDEAGQMALDEGRIIIAAAGNSSSRDIGYIAPVDFPANSPTVMAVAAVDSRSNLTNFSAGTPVGGCGVDIAGPGAGIFSSMPMPRHYQRLRGTSMAAPHVAGVACLWAESDPSLRAKALWNRLVSSAKPLPINKLDVGAGLVQAPKGNF